MTDPMPCPIPLDEVADPCPFPGVLTREWEDEWLDLIPEGGRVDVVAMDVFRDGECDVVVDRTETGSIPTSAIAVDVSRPGGQQLVGRWLHLDEAWDMLDGTGRALAVEALHGSLDIDGQRDICALCALVARVLEARHG